jgi:hypothetical protein
MPRGWVRDSCRRPWSVPVPAGSARSLAAPPATEEAALRCGSLGGASSSTGCVGSATGSSAGGSSRYPTPHTVANRLGFAGSASIFSLRRRTWTVTVDWSASCSLSPSPTPRHCARSRWVVREPGTSLVDGWSHASLFADGSRKRPATRTDRPLPQRPALTARSSGSSHPGRCRPLAG